MWRISAALVAGMVLFISGCTAQKGYVVGPFAHYSHETFAKEATGETGLYVAGEDWYTLIDLKGFESIDTRLESTDQFLYRENGGRIRVSVFAEKTDAAKDSSACMKRVYKSLPYRRTAGVEPRDIGGKKALVQTVGRTKQVDYCTYYKGYCFDFRFVMDRKTNESAIAGILDSIAFVDDAAIGERMRKTFYINEKKIRLAVPDTWNHAFKAGLQYTPSIVFTPSEGNGFRLYLSPYKGFETLKISPEDVRGMAMAKMSAWDERAAIAPALKEIRDLDAVIWYFDVKDRYYHEEDVGDYPFRRQGFALVENSVLQFTMLYRESGKEDVDKALDAIARAEVLSLYTDPRISLSN